MNGQTLFETGTAPKVVPPPVPTPRTFLGGKISTFKLKSLPTKVSVFCPKAALSARNVDVLVYAHGLLGSCGTVNNPPEGLITGNAFQMGQFVDASGRALVLVVPLFDWTKPGFHFLGKPANLNTLITESLAQLALMLGGAAPTLSNLILSGHSRGYDFLEPLARANADPQMAQGALGKLSEIWAFDTTYVLDVAAWIKWLKSKPGLKATVIYRRNTKPTRTPVGTMRAGDALFAARTQAGAQLNVIQISAETGEGHCQVPVRRLPALLGANASPAPPVTTAVPQSQPASLASPTALRSQIVKVAQAELSKWGQGTKKETDPAMRSTLAGYWSSVLKGQASISNAIDKRTAWSAAFISWVMKQAGAGSAFQPSSAHTRYIAAAGKARDAGDKTKFWAHRVTEVTPEPGDLICRDRKPTGKNTCAGVTYDNVGQGGPSHSDIVLAINPANRQMTVVGGNVDDSVKSRIIQLTTDGHLPAPSRGACKFIAIMKAPGMTPVTPTQPTTSAPSTTPTVSVGGCADDRCNSTYIRWMQTSLLKNGFKLTVTGKLDDPTLKAIVLFKRRAGLKTKEAYAGPTIERALIAAGAAPSPSLTKLPCGATPSREMVALLNKYRGDIPLEILMGWAQVESGLQIGSSTSICERGYFQLHPGNSIELKLDHDLIGTDKDYSVRAGIALVNQCRRFVKALGVPTGTDLYWRLVKLCHWLPSGPKKLLAVMRKSGVEPRDWATILSFVSQHDEALKPTFAGHPPSQGTQNVDHMFKQVEAWRRKLGLPASFH
jgi:hypothetical protein